MAADWLVGARRAQMRHSKRVLLAGGGAGGWGSLRRVLAGGGRCVRSAGSFSHALEILAKKVYDLVVVDLAASDACGSAVVGKIRERSPSTTVVVVAGRPAAGISAVKSGAYDLIVRPFTPRSLKITVQRALARRKGPCESVLLYSDLGGDVGFEALVGRGAAMKGVRDLVLRASQVDSALLIRGASGTGKELVARTIHRHSRRKGKPFVTVKCGSLKGEMLEEELFGSMKKRLSGTAEGRGCLRVAEGGSLFLDEVDNICGSMQVRLLRLIQRAGQREVSTALVPDVRVLAATNTDLEAAVGAGRFRRDLFYALNTVSIGLPRLAERREDIPPLLEYFLGKYGTGAGRGRRARVSEGAMRALLAHDWPGNVRELENTVKRALILCGEREIGGSHLLYCGPASPLRSDAGVDLSLARLEEEHIRKILGVFSWHKGRTAEALGVDRKTLRAKMRKYGIGPEKNDERARGVTPPVRRGEGGIV